jgi:hypothetical protein
MLKNKSGNAGIFYVDRKSFVPALPDFLRSSGPGTEPLSFVSTIQELLERKIAAAL